MGSFPDINWITKGENFEDYRPAIGPDGGTVIFERTFFDIYPPVNVTLFRMVSLDDKDPAPFVPGDVNALTRPDWCWNQNKIAYNRAETENDVQTVWQINDDGTNRQEIMGTQFFLYPQWDRDGKTLTVMNKNVDSANPKPCSTVIDLKSETIKYPNADGTDQNGTPLFGGMPAVNPNDPLTIAFAGQPVLANWNPGQKVAKYNQDRNYIFLNSFTNQVFSSSPLEKGASITNFDPKYQGRAPAWSPHGRYIVFESNRADSSKELYALYLFDTQGNGAPPQQLTCTGYNTQHAKFFHDGARLIFAGKPEPTSRFRIGWIDISRYVS